MPVVTYSLLRIALFLAATGVLWGVGMRSWLAPVIGAVIGFALSYVLLTRQRDAAARHLADRAARRGASGGTVARDAQDEDAEASVLPHGTGGAER
ncbi:DUF4229 domain-containing protein [Cellulomonas sp. zg-ZUI222]|uniref:DUF4229 domain-containing protein n=1 Tax=Cellulomonas wangleii TaxID=2816956 RepID=A0ABX8D399_9CELL|nr:MULTISPECIES: DUF4229 domain-containing protein [Cellulomonas]MBO0899565.1 DUF4229 domain-containing protein [Cellulomonas sp. zg-ZUI22]MBO0920428.1 DUF4229 domain-containing protein [Cellulomonas wangleii]MBO0923154.1 DUF4229 domain-containing protein [Cellulomonas wangleii]QVI61531.1 DUF4229 domain-containing protein [Cellulomonas wangleii]